jgi:hypothetical protein
VSVCPPPPRPNFFVFDAVRVVSKESRRLVLSRTYYRLLIIIINYYYYYIGKIKFGDTAYQTSSVRCFFLMSFVALNIAPLSWKQSAFVFLLGTYVTLPRSVAPSATALQLDVFLLQMQFVNVQIFLITHARVCTIKSLS